MLTQTVSSVESFLLLMSGMLDKVAAKSASISNAVSERLVVFCITWSVAARLVDSDRNAFDVFLRTLSQDMPVKVRIQAQSSIEHESIRVDRFFFAVTPAQVAESETIFDFVLHATTMEWVLWHSFEAVSTKSLSTCSLINQKYFDTLRYGFLLQLAFSTHKVGSV